MDPATTMEALVGIIPATYSETREAIERYSAWEHYHPRPPANAVDCVLTPVIPALVRSEGRTS